MISSTVKAVIRRERISIILRHLFLMTLPLQMECLGAGWVGMISRRNLGKGLLAAAALALVPIKVVAERFPWGPWQRLNLPTGYGRGSMRHRLDGSRMQFEIILQPVSAVTRIKTNIVIDDVK